MFLEKNKKNKKLGFSVSLIQFSITSNDLKVDKIRICDIQLLYHRYRYHYQYHLKPLITSDLPCIDLVNPLHLGQFRPCSKFYYINFRIGLGTTTCCLYHMGLSRYRCCDQNYSFYRVCLVHYSCKIFGKIKPK